MEPWQLAIMTASLLYIGERIGTAIMAAQRLRMEKKMINLQEKINETREDVMPSLELWWNDNGGSKPAEAFIEREASNTPELFRVAHRLELHSEIHEAVCHYALDLKAAPLYDALDQLSTKVATTPLQHAEVRRAIKERRDHMQLHEESLIRYGYDIADLVKLFGPSTVA